MPTGYGIPVIYNTSEKQLLICHANIWDTVLITIQEYDATWITAQGLALLA